MVKSSGTIKTPVRIWERIAFCVGLYLFFFLGYGLSNRLVPLDTCMDFTVSWDRLVPFEPLFVWPFYLAYLLVLLPGILIRSRELLFNTAVAFGVLIAVSVALFFLVPVQVPRPAEIPGTLSGSLVARVFEADRPVCGFPSLHVSASVLAAAALFRQRWVLGALAAPLAIATSVSTLFIKQHVLIDVAGGVVLAFLVDWAATSGRVMRLVSKKR